MRDLEHRSRPTSDTTLYIDAALPIYPFLTVSKALETAILAPSTTELNKSDDNYQAMLTAEPLDTTNIVDAPANLSTPFD